MLEHQRSLKLAMNKIGKLWKNILYIYIKNHDKNKTIIAVNNY